MKIKGVNITIFLLSFICLIVSVMSFINIAIFSDEFNTSPNIILGGELWLYMNWLELGFLSAILIISGLNIFTKQNN